MTCERVSLRALNQRWNGRRTGAPIGLGGFGCRTVGKDEHAAHAAECLACTAQNVQLLGSARCTIGSELALASSGDPVYQTSSLRCCIAIGLLGALRTRRPPGPCCGSDVIRIPGPLPTPLSSGFSCFLSRVNHRYHTPAMLSATRTGIRRGIQGISRRAYSETPSTDIWGHYKALDPASALSSYPEPLPVPDQIPRPAYVPDNFFSHPIWEHSEPKEEEHGGPIVMGSEDEHRVRTAAKTAADILSELGKHVKVCSSGTL